MTRNEALKRWKEEVKKWNVYNTKTYSHSPYISLSSMKTFIEVLDALIAPEEHAQKTAENRHVPETCTEKAEISTDDGWKPWPPENLCDIPYGPFEISGNPKYGFGYWKAFCYPEGIYLNADCPKELMKWWRNAKAD